MSTNLFERILSAGKYDLPKGTAPHWSLLSDYLRIVCNDDTPTPLQTRVNAISANQMDGILKVYTGAYVNLDSRQALCDPLRLRVLTGVSTGDIIEIPRSNGYEYYLICDTVDYKGFSRNNNLRIIRSSDYQRGGNSARNRVDVDTMRKMLNGQPCTLYRPINVSNLLPPPPNMSDFGDGYVRRSELRTYMEYTTGHYRGTYAQDLPGFDDLNVFNGGTCDVGDFILMEKTAVATAPPLAGMPEYTLEYRYFEVHVAQNVNLPKNHVNPVVLETMRFEYKPDHWEIEYSNQGTMEQFAQNIVNNNQMIDIHSNQINNLYNLITQLIGGDNYTIVDSPDASENPNIGEGAGIQITNPLPPVDASLANIYHNIRALANENPVLEYFTNNAYVPTAYSTKTDMRRASGVPASFRSVAGNMTHYSATDLGQALTHRAKVSNWQAPQPGDTAG